MHNKRYIAHVVNNRSRLESSDAVSQLTTHPNPWVWVSLAILDLGMCVCTYRLHRCSHVKSRGRRFLCLHVLLCDVMMGPLTEWWCPLLRMMVKVYLLGISIRYRNQVVRMLNNGIPGKEVIKSGKGYSSRNQNELPEAAVNPVTVKAEYILRLAFAAAIMLLLYNACRGSLFLASQLQAYTANSGMV
ncbi:hypothetical protein BGX38DRAFT_1154193 [Terfezia claveryi]|nr:hypothetical protein BGX38DRAFT_1154193 [Terfezia claveryi]